jgi:hypothetical protein
MQIETGAQLYICDPTQTQFAVFNSPLDPNFVGYINPDGITGFDSADVRENAQNINAGDGGYHGPFWVGRRPWTLSGFIMPTTPVSARSAAMTKIDNVMNACLKQDGYLTYTPSDGITRYLTFRKQQPQRITGGQSAVQKDFQISGVCRDYRFFRSGAPSGVGTFETGDTFNCVGQGNALAPCKYTMTGPCDNVHIYNQNQDKAIFLVGMPTGTIPQGDGMVIDLTGTYPSAYRESDGLNLYGYIDPIGSDLGIGVAPGSNEYYFSCNAPSAGHTSLTVNWNDAWS